MRTANEKTVLHPASTQTEKQTTAPSTHRSIEQPTHWEKVAETRWGKYITAIEQRAILFAGSLFEKKTTALEVGCEGGRWTKLLDSLGWEMTCMDVNPKVLGKCHARVPRARCILVSPDGRTLPCETASLDLLLCIEVLPVAQSDWFASEARRVLRPRGALVTVVSNSLSARACTYRVLTAFDGKRKEFRNESSIYSTTYRSWKKQLTANGFEVVREEGMCWLPFSRESDSPLIPRLTRWEEKLGFRRLTSLSPSVTLVARKVL